MKRNFYALCLCLLVVVSSKAQTLLSESFESTTFPPTGWTLVNAGSGSPWTQNTTSTYAYDGTKSLQYAYEATGTFAANAWAFTPSLALNSARAYYISFYVRARSASFPEKLKFTVGNAATVAAQTTSILDSSNITNVAFRKWSTIYTPATTGNYNFGFNCYSLADEFNLYVDSITIFEGLPPAPCSGTPVGGSATASTNILCAAGTVALSVTGASTDPGLTYQWQSSPAGANNWTPITGATTATYSASVTASTDYRRLTICSNGGASTPSASVNVTLSGPPSNDLVCNAIALTLNGTSQCGNTTCATSTGDPTFSASTANNTVWYTYTPTTTGTVAVKFKRPAGVTTGLLNGWLGFFTSSSTCSGTLTEVPGTSYLGYNLITTDSVTATSVSLTAGTTYYLMVDGNSGAFGAYCLQLITPPPIPSCSPLLLPANGSTTVDNLFTLVWNKSANATSYDVYISTTTPPTLAVSNVADTSISLSATVAGTHFYWYIIPKGSSGSAVGCNSNIYEFTTRSTPVNDSCGAAISLITGVTTTGALTGATTSPVPSTTCGTATYTSVNDVWYRITAGSNGAASISVTGNYGTGFNPVIAVYSGTCSTPTLLSCSDASATTTETISLPSLVAGSTYLVRVFANGTVGNGGFTITATGTALPVTGVNLSAIRNNKSVQLDWKTETEVNNAGFQIQRSADGKEFTSIMSVASKATNGNSSSTINYTAEDAKPFSGANYYRLKQTDRDGKVSYSNVVYLKGTLVNNLTVSAIYPNPTKDVLKAAIQSPAAETITFVITDMTGKIIARQNASVTSGDNTINLNVANLAAGSYLLKAICANGCETGVQKFTKQ